MAVVVRIPVGPEADDRALPVTAEMRREQHASLATALLDLRGCCEADLRTITVVQRCLERIREPRVTAEAELLVDEMARRIRALAQSRDGHLAALTAAASAVELLDKM